MKHETTIDHEVRIRLLEKIAEKIDSRFEHLENKIHTNFLWTLGCTLGAMVTLSAAMVTIILTLHV